MRLRLYGPNILYNGDLERGDVSSWGLYYNASSGALADLSVSTAAPYRGNYEMFVDVKSFSARADNIQVYQQNVRVLLGVPTAVRFAGRAEVDWSTRVNYLLGMSPYTLYYYGYSSLTTAYQQFEHTFTMAADVNSGSIRFYCGSGGVTPEDIYLDEISLRHYIDLPVGYDYARAEVLQRHDARALGGALHTYIEPNGYRRFTLPLTHVTSAERSLLNAWWLKGEEVHFVEDNTAVFSFWRTRIVGNEEPITKNVQPYHDQFAGELVLETI